MRGLLRLNVASFATNNIGGMSMRTVLALGLCWLGVWMVVCRGSMAQGVNLFLLEICVPALIPLMLRWVIAGTLEPVRNLTGLIYLDLQSNTIGGMSSVPLCWNGGGCVGVWMPERWGINHGNTHP